MKKNKSMKKYLLVGVLVVVGLGYGLYAYCPWFNGLVMDKVESVAVGDLLDKAKGSLSGLKDKVKSAADDVKEKVKDTVEDKVSGGPASLDII